MRNKYYVQGCIECIDEVGQRFVEEAASSDIVHFWGVYERNEGGLSLCIADFWDVDRAQEYVKWLLER